MSQKLLNQIDFRAFVMANNGQPVTTSMAVAQVFKKRHDDVLRKIRVLIAALKKNNLHHHVRNFTEMLETVEVGKGAKRQTPVFEMNIDGFTLLAMGFNGDEALVFKTGYIDAFNWMQNLIAQQGLTLSKRHNLLSLKFDYEKADASVAGRCLRQWQDTKSNILNELQRLEAQMQPMLDLFGLESEKAPSILADNGASINPKPQSKGTDV